MNTKKIVSLAIGSAFAAAALTPMAHATGNPFGATKLESAYQLAQADTKKKDGKCGEAKCGAEKKAAEAKAAEAKCGADKKVAEAQCGADKKAPEAKCGADKKSEATCGAKK
jgi:uncharacterized low-complexity protein